MKRASVDSNIWKEIIFHSIKLPSDQLIHFLIGKGEINQSINQSIQSITIQTPKRSSIVLNETCLFSGTIVLTPMDSTQRTGRWSELRSSARSGVAIFIYLFLKIIKNRNRQKKKFKGNAEGKESSSKLTVVETSYIVAFPKHSITPRGFN